MQQCGCCFVTELEALKKEWMQEMKLQMAGNEEEMAEMAKSYEQKLKEAQEKAGMVKKAYFSFKITILKYNDSFQIQFNPFFANLCNS